MASVKTKVIDTSSTTPSEFLASGAGKPVETAPPLAGEQPAPVVEPSPEPRPITEPEPLPNRPGLETTDMPTPDPDPFVLIHKWEKPTNVPGVKTFRTLRGLPVPGGIVLRLSTATSPNLTESLVFLPNTTLENGVLVGK